MVPLTLTHWDLGYLKSLYATSNALLCKLPADGDMEHELVKELARALRASGKGPYEFGLKAAVSHSHHILKSAASDHSGR